MVGILVLIYKQKRQGVLILRQDTREFAEKVYGFKQKVIEIEGAVFLKLLLILLIYQGYILGEKIVRVFEIFTAIDKFVFSA